MSFLEPGKHLPAHFGFFRGIYRYHLGIIVPEGDQCFLDVKGEKYFWKEGEHMMFDDTYMHQARNNSAHPRVILFIDVLRDRSLPRFLRPLNRKMFIFLSKLKRIKKAAKRAEIA